MKNADLYQLVFRCLIGDKNIIEELKNNVILNEDNLFRFIHVSSNHFVLPAIYIRLKNLGLTLYIPDDLNEHLNEICTLNTKRNKEFLQQADEINQQLAKEGIEPVYLKGTGNLLDNLYPNPGDRIIGDIDFLVREKEFLKTAEAIKQMGYVTDLKIYDDPKTLKDYPRLTREDVPAALEIHQMPVIPKYAKWFTTEKVFSEKKQISSQINCYVPSDKHKLIINFIHSQLSDKRHMLKNIALRDLYDLYLISERASHKEAIQQIKEKRKAQVYFDFIPQLVSCHENKIPRKESQIFFKKHQWFLNHPEIHKRYSFIIKLNYLLTNRFLKAFVSKSVYKNLAVRVKDRDWWKDRLLKNKKIKEIISGRESDLKGNDGSK